MQSLARRDSLSGYVTSNMALGAGMRYPVGQVACIILLYYKINVELSQELEYGMKSKPDIFVLIFS